LFWNNNFTIETVLAQITIVAMYLLALNDSNFNIEANTFNFKSALNVNTGSFNLLLNGSTIRSYITIASIERWQNWTTVSITSMELPFGEHLLRLLNTGPGTNNNYFTTDFESLIPASPNSKVSP